MDPVRRGFKLAEWRALEVGDGADPAAVRGAGEFEPSKTES